MNSFLWKLQKRFISFVFIESCIQNVLNTFYATEMGDIPILCPEYIFLDKLRRTFGICQRQVQLVVLCALEIRNVH